MKNKLNINLTNAITQSTLARENGVISEAAQNRILRRINGRDEYDILCEQIARQERAEAKIQGDAARARIAPLQAQIAAEIAPIIERINIAELDVFLLEYRTAEELAAERTYTVTKRLTAADKPAIAFGPEWWEAEELKEREAKKAIRRKLKKGEFVPELELIKYGFHESDNENESELVDA